MKKKSKKKEIKENILPYFVVSAIFLIFVAFILLIKKFGTEDGIAITGNAVLDTGQLNPNYLFVMLTLIAVYGIVVGVYFKHRDTVSTKKSGSRKKRRSKK